MEVLETRMPRTLMEDMATATVSVRASDVVVWVSETMTWKLR